MSKQMPEKLHELQRLWMIEATRYNVLPLDDTVAKRMNPDTAGRPILIKGTHQITGGPVSTDYGPHGNEFTGLVKGVELDIADDAKNSDHLVSPEEAVRIALARQ